MTTTKMIAKVRLPLISLRCAYDINPQFSSTRRGDPRPDRAFERAPCPCLGPPMYQHIIGDKRASLSPAQRPRNGFCSTAGRRETRTDSLAPSVVRPSARKGSDFNAHAMGVRIDVRLGRAQAQILYTMKRSNALEDGVRQRLLKIVAPGECNFLHLRAEEIVVPCAGRIVIGRHIRVIEPDFDRNQQALRRADFEVVKSNVSLHRQRIEQYPRGPHPDALGDQSDKRRFVHSSSRMFPPDGDTNCTSRTRPMNRWPESMTSTCPVTHFASTK